MRSFVSIVTILSLIQLAVSESPVEVIQKHLKSRYGSTNPPDSLCKFNKCCVLSDMEGCTLDKMPRDDNILVLPGGETRCIFSTSTPYAFQIIPGDSNKLVFYFQGGGACWDEFSVKMGLCTTDVVPQTGVGIFDRHNELNAFKSHTIVHVSYCSGDVHGGNTVTNFKDPAGEMVVQKGLANAQSALDWVTAQIKLGHQPAVFDELVLMGCSAGSLGVQIWAKQLLSTLAYQKAVIVPDSYAGVFPPNALGPLIYQFGYCSSGFLSAELYGKCMAQTLQLTEIVAEGMKAHPDIPWGYLQSKTDATQMAFYESVALTNNGSHVYISPTQFYRQVNAIFGGYNKQAANFLTYLVDDNHHCFTDQTYFYTASTLGPASVASNTASASALSSNKTLAAWLSQYPLSNGQAVQTECDGQLLLAGEEEEELAKGRPENTYCDRHVVPKTFTEQYAAKANKA